jgi:uncharacterized membrane protein YhaH (DUF805 family)
MDFMTAVKSGFRNYAIFTGRASRSEFWFWILFVFLVTSAGSIVDAAIFQSSSPGLFAPLISLGLLLPDIAVSVRRLHDTDRSGLWLLIWFTLIGIIVLIVWFCRKGTPGANRFGPNPLETQILSAPRG